MKKLLQTTSLVLTCAFLLTACGGEVDNAGQLAGVWHRVLYTCGDVDQFGETQTLTFHKSGTMISERVFKRGCGLKEEALFAWSGNSSMVFSVLNKSDVNCPSGSVEPYPTETNTRQVRVDVNNLVLTSDKCVEAYIKIGSVE